MDATDITALRADYATLLANACTIKRIPVNSTTHTSQGTLVAVATTYCNVFTPGQGTTPVRLTPMMQAAMTIEQGRVLELPMNASIVWTDVFGTKATGTLNCADKAIRDETLTINGAVFTFVNNSASNAHQIVTGSNGATQATLIAAALAASVDPLVTVATYTDDGTGIVTVQYATGGTVGNAFTLATNSASIAPSGATLTGGAADASANKVLKKNDKVVVGTSEYTVMDLYADMSYQMGLVVTAQKTQ